MCLWQGGLTDTGAEAVSFFLSFFSFLGNMGGLRGCERSCGGGGKG